MFRIWCGHGASSLSDASRASHLTLTLYQRLLTKWGTCLVLVWQWQVLVETPSRTYTANDFEQLFTDLGLNETRVSFLSVAVWAYLP